MTTPKEFDPAYRKQVNRLVDQYRYGGQFPGVEKLSDVTVQLVPLALPRRYPPRPDLVFIQSLQTPNGPIFAALDDDGTLFLGERPKWVEDFE